LKIDTADCHLDVSVDTLERRYREVIEHARGDGETRILAKTFQAAMAGNMRALELSLINRCGWTLRPETIINVTQNAAPPVVTAEEFKRRLNRVRELSDKFEASLGEAPPCANRLDGNGTQA
jgi:hypothetical protein